MSKNCTRKVGSIFSRVNAVNHDARVIEIGMVSKKIYALPRQLLESV